MSVSYGRGSKGKATRLHSQVVRLKRKCEMCGETDFTKLQCAHIIPRRYNATRTDEAAAWCLCWKCHRETTDWPDAHMDLVDKTIGRKRYNELRRLASGGKAGSEVFWQEEIARLQEILKNNTEIPPPDKALD